MATRTPKQLAAGQRRSLKAMEARLREMASEWEDLDEYMISSLTEAADKLQDVQVDLLNLPEGED